MSEKLFYSIIIVILTILLLYICNMFYLKDNENHMIKNNIIIDNIYIDNETYMKKLKEEEETLEKEIMNKYDTLNKEELDKIISNINSDIDNITKDLANRNEEKNNLENKKIQLNNQLQTLKKKKEEEIKAQNENTFMINNVPTFNQYPTYYTGCESVALYILLKYYNIDVSVDEIIEKLPKGSLPYQEDNIIYGGNPNLEFIGSPYEKSSFGVYDYPISQVANQYKENIINETGKNLNEVLNIVKENRPVLVWNSMGLALPYISQSWIYKPTGEKIDWIANEHAVVIIGYSDNRIIISDPMGGTIKYLDRYTFEQRYNSYGKRNLYY